MYVSYLPEGDERRDWEFDPRRVRASRAEMVEKRYGDKWDVWLNDLQTGSIRARRVLLWHLMSAEHPALKYEDTPDFYANELELEYNVAELEEIRTSIAQNKAYTDDEREVVYAQIDAQLDEARKKHPEGDPGKAPSNGEGSPTP